MEQLELTHEELAVLRDVLQHRVGELNIEVLHTDTRDFKEMLKSRKLLLESILKKISATPVAA